MSDLRDSAALHLHALPAVFRKQSMPHLARVDEHVTGQDRANLDSWRFIAHRRQRHAD